MKPQIVNEQAPVHQTTSGSRRSKCSWKGLESLLEAVCVVLVPLM